MYKHKKSKNIKIESSFVFEKNKFTDTKTINLPLETIDQPETINQPSDIIETINQPPEIIETIVQPPKIIETIDQPPEIKSTETIDQPPEIKSTETIDQPPEIKSTETIDQPPEIKSSETIVQSSEIKSAETIVQLPEIIKSTETIDQPPEFINSQPEIIDVKETKKKIDTLCFSGGGVKGLSFVGALEKLIESKIINLDDITLFVGTSAGAMLSFLLNLGWTIRELKDFILNFNFSKLIGEIDCINFFSHFGIENGDRLKLLFIKFLESKFDKKDITFKELFEITNKKLIIIGTNLTQGCEKVFSVDETPDFSIIIALRISCSIPIVFLPVEYNNEFYVDGGIVNNFPINYCSKKSTLGFYVKNSNNNVIDSVQTLISATLRLTADTISEKNIKKYLSCIVQIKNTDFRVANFEVNLEHKLKIIELGYNSAELYIKNKPIEESIH